MSLRGTVGESADLVRGAVTTPIYALTHLSDAAAGLQCFGMDGCSTTLPTMSVWDHPSLILMLVGTALST